MIHVAARLLDVWVLAAAADRAGMTLGSRLSAWDGGWFVRIAAEGYPPFLDLSNPTVDQRTGGLAFLPVYPMLMRGISAVSGLSLPTAGILVSVVAALVAAAGVYTLTERLTSRPVAVLAVALWSVLPMSIVLTMVYTEALFTALAVWALVAAMRERWLMAGMLAFVAGLTRATGLALGVAVVAGIILAVRRSGLTWRMVLGGLLALAGTPTWWLWTWARTGQPDAWFAVQREFWGSQFDFGRELSDTALDTLLFRNVLAPEQRLVYTAAIVLLLLAVVLALDLVIRTVRDLRWLVPTVYAVAVLGLTLGGAGYVFSKIRFVLPMVPLLIPVAIVLGRTRRPVAVAAVVVLGLAGAWWGAFMLTVWTAAI